MADISGEKHESAAPYLPGLKLKNLIPQISVRDILTFGIDMRNLVSVPNIVLDWDQNWHTLVSSTMSSKLLLRPMPELHPVSDRKQKFLVYRD